MNNHDVCDNHCIHQDAVLEVKAKMLPSKIFKDVSENFKIIGDLTRVKILFALSKKELCVCDLSSIIGMSESAISHQLRLLRNHNMVKFRKDGKMAYYSLGDTHVIQLLKMGVEHATHI
jgi:DNA-binding transcriptional ArsR family regulator